MPFKACNDNVLVKELKEQNVAGGIIIPNSSKEFISAEVISAPKDSDIKAGDTVMYKKDAAGDIIVDNVALKILKIRDVALSS